MKKKILISAANGIIMNSLITSLKKNFYVIGIDTQKYGNAKKYCDEFYTSPKGDKKEFLHFLSKFSQKVDFIFLYVDEEIFNVSLNKHKLKNIGHKIIISNKKTIEICINKKKFNQFFKRKKINIPSSTFSSRMIAKPIFGRGGKNIFKINNKNDYLFFKKNKNFILQKLIVGKEYTVDCLFDNKGKLLFSLPRERIVEKGVSIVGKITKSKRIEIFIKKISKKLSFNGPINVQLIIDKKKKIWLIEINPRLSGSIEFSIKSGFNPFLYYLNKKYVSKIKYGKVFSRYLNISK